MSTVSNIKIIKDGKTELSPNLLVKIGIVENEDLVVARVHNHYVVGSWAEVTNVLLDELGKGLKKAGSSQAEMIQDSEGILFDSKQNA